MTEGAERESKDIMDVLDRMIAEDSGSDDGRLFVFGPDFLKESPEAIAERKRFREEQDKRRLEEGRRDLEASIRAGLREEMDIVAKKRHPTPHKLDVAREELRRLSVEVQVDPGKWLELLEKRHPDVGAVLPVVDGECRLELTDYRTLAEAAAVIPATVPDRGLVVLFDGRELRARNGRRFHKRAWTDVLDEGIIGPVRSPRGGLSSSLRSALDFLPGYSRNLRRWKEI